MLNLAVYVHVVSMLWVGSNVYASIICVCGTIYSWCIEMQLNGCVWVGLVMVYLRCMQMCMCV